MKIQDGAMAVDRKQYAVAIPMLKKEYNKSKTRIEKGKKAYLIAQSYDALHQAPDAISWYKIAYDNQYGIDAFKAYAYALKQNEQYNEAAAAFKELGLEVGSPYEYRKEITACKVAADWKAEKRQEYTVEVMSFNTGSSDYAPVLIGDNKMAFTSDRSAATGDDTYNWTNKAFTDIFTVDLKSQNVTPFDNAVNSAANEANLIYSKDKNTIFFTRCDAPKGMDAYCKIMSSTQETDGSWSAAKALSFQQEGINYMHPALANDGKLYFSSDDSEGWGGFDIYYTELKAGQWTEPVRLSRSINTTKDDQFPQFDNDTLYFASKGHTGMGGLDIFRSYSRGENKWSPAWNMKSPINSGYDDFGFVVDRSHSSDGKTLEKGYFSSRRGEIGQDDIYEYKRIKLPPVPVQETIVYENILDVYVLEKVYENPDDPNSRVLARKALAGADLRIKVGKEEKSFKVGEDGKISLNLQDNKKYDFFASHEGYLNNKANFSSIGLGRDPRQAKQVYEVEIVLDKIFLNQEITLENIYYDFDQSYIRKDAEPTLLELAQLLKDNPDIRIQLGSHTDCRGGNQYNEDLSRKRALAAVDFLIQNEIDPARLEARGYGEEEPYADCACNRCTEEEHQENRRTTFKILE